MKKIGIVLVAIGCLLAATTVSAQTADPFSSLTSIQPGDIDVILSPENPGPRQIVSITLRSDSTDLTRARISWFVQEKQVLSGIGKNSLSVQTRDYGQPISITITITTIDGTVLNRSLTLSAEDMTVHWEAVDAYAPPFYKGKKLSAQEALVKVAAVPLFGIAAKSADTRQASFIWSRNSDKLPASSGWANDSIIIKQNNLRTSEAVSVSAQDQSGAHSARGSVTVTPTTPRTLLFVRDPDTGVRSPYAFGSYKTDKTFVLEAVPFGLSRAAYNNDGFQSTWTVNGNSISTPGDPLSFLVRPPGTSGVAQFIGLITSPLFPSQKASVTGNVIFQ